MRDLAVGLLLLSFSVSGWSQQKALSDCLNSQTAINPACTVQIIRFESQHAYVPEIASNVGIDPELLLAVIAVESGYNDLKRTDRGGIGPMQVTAIAAQDLGINDLTYLLSDKENVRAGSHYLRKMMLRFGDWRLALAAYNAGPGAVQRYRGIPPYRETQGYVKQVLWWYMTLKNRTV